MAAAIGSAALGRVGDTALVSGTVQTTPDGRPYFVLDQPLAGGSIFSVDNDGGVHGAAAVGPWEVFTPEGGTVVYAHVENGVVYAHKFLFSPSLPL